MARISRSGIGGKGVLSKKSGGNENINSGKALGTKVENNQMDVKNTPFMNALNAVEVNFNKEELKKSLESLTEIGDHLVRNPNLKLMEEYKKKIHIFLKEALKKMYKLDNKEGLKKFGQEQKIYINVDKIDRKLERMMLKFIEGQEASLNLINDVEGIQGLLYNIIA